MPSRSVPNVSGFHGGNLTEDKVTQEHWFRGKLHKSQHAGLEGTWKTVCFQPYIHLRLYLIWTGYTNLRNTFGFEQSAGLCTGVNLEMVEPPYQSRSFPQVAYNLQLAPPPKPNQTSKTTSLEKKNMNSRVQLVCCAQAVLERKAKDDEAIPSIH